MNYRIFVVHTDRKDKRGKDIFYFVAVETEGNYEAVVRMINDQGVLHCVRIFVDMHRQKVLGVAGSWKLSRGQRLKIKDISHTTFADVEPLIRRGYENWVKGH